MTDNEIIKALEKALTDVDAPIGEHWGSGFLSTQTIKSALDLINRQKAEIERLREVEKLCATLYADAKGGDSDA